MGLSRSNQKPILDFHDATFPNYASEPLLQSFIRRVSLAVHPFAGVKYLNLMLHSLVHNHEEAEISKRNLQVDGFNRKAGGADGVSPPPFTPTLSLSLLVG